MEVWIYYTFIDVSILESLFAEKSQSKKKQAKVELLKTDMC